MRKITSVAAMFVLALLLLSCTKTERTYYPDGHVQSIIQYRFGKEHGKTQYYYDNPNTLEIEVQMHRGKRNGEFFRYFENGALDAHAFYVNDSLDGVQTLYTANGEKTQETTYSHGHREGPFRAYHLNGDLNIEGNFKNDLYDGKWSYYDERGVLVGEGDFHEGSGEQVSYDARGLKSLLTRYVRNEKDGKEEYYDQNGRVIREITYKQGRIVSQWEDSTMVK
ncbi:MAG: toxin-antitoxin system YwqK family antitoxin [Bacteroidales bacterium]|nr:toxin-antitoxin system YwqK family antitoxin [Bacteroidales bacterium]